MADQYSTIGFPVERAAGGDLLVDVGQEPIGNYIGFQVDASLFESELLHGRGMRCLRHLEHRIAGRRRHANTGPELAGPVVDAGIQMLRRQHGLRENVAECRAQTAAGGIDVALPAFESQLHGEIGLGMCRIGGEADKSEQESRAAVRSGRSCAGSTVNSNEMSVPSVAAFRLASAPPPVPRTVTR